MGITILTRNIDLRSCMEAKCNSWINRHNLAPRLTQASGTLENMESSMYNVTSPSYLENLRATTTHKNRKWIINASMGNRKTLTSMRLLPPQVNQGHLRDSNVIIITFYVRRRYTFKICILVKHVMLPINMGHHMVKRTPYIHNSICRTLHI